MMSNVALLLLDLRVNFHQSTLIRYFRENILLFFKKNYNIFLHTGAKENEKKIFLISQFMVLQTSGIYNSKVEV